MEARFRRYAPTPAAAKNLEARISGAVATGTWKQLKEELSRTKEANNPTIREFAEVYYNGYCLVRNKRPDFKEHALKPIKEHLGRFRVKDFRRAHAHDFVGELSKRVKPATVNRVTAVLKNMMSFAVDREVIAVNPLAGFKLLPEEEKALRVMTVEEERRLIESIEDASIAAYVAILGETGLRKEEGLKLKWQHIDFEHGILAVEQTKSRKARYVPLSDYAIEWLESLPRQNNSPYVFVCLETGDRWMDPRGPFERGKKKAKLEWVGFHDLRRFRATQWVIQGVDLVTIQTLLGHKSIATTMRYVHLSPTYTARVVVEAQRREALALQEKNRRKEADAEKENGTNGANSFIPLKCERGDSNPHGVSH
jgi:integrase